VAVEVALVGKADGQGDVGERELSVAEHLLDVLQAATEHVAVRRHAEGLLEGAGKMVRGEAGESGESVEADLFADVRLDKIADAVLHGGGKAAALRIGRHGHGHEAEHAEARLGMDDGFGPVAREIGFGERRSEQGAPVVGASGAGEEDGNVLAGALAEEGWIVIEKGGEGRAGGERFVVERECLARDAVGADEALVVVNGKKHGGCVIGGRQGGDDPFVAEVFAEEALFDGAGGGDGGGEGELLRAIGAVGGDGGNVENAGKFAEGVEDGGAGAGKFAVARAIVLAAMDKERTLFGDAGADAVGAFDLFGPDAAEPDAPALEIVGTGFVSAVVDGDAGFVAKKDDVALLADDRVEAIDLFAGVGDDVGDGFLGDFQFALGDYVWRGLIFGVDVIVGHAAVPGVGDFVDGGG